ncbi:MAG: hypothetical protein AB7G93_12385 [Bdellovibrionales bacterium]
MNVRYVSKDLEWTSSMKECVSHRIVDPLRRHLKSEDFELSVHLEMGRKRMRARKPWFELWVVLQSFDGAGNKIVRRQGNEFPTLVSEVSSAMRACLRKTHLRRRLPSLSTRCLFPMMSEA